MYQTIVLVICAIQPINSYLLIPENQNEFDLTCFENLIQTLNPDYLVTVLEDKFVLNLPPKIILNPRVEIEADIYDGTWTKASSYVILLNKLKFREAIQFLKDSSTWYPKSKFIVFAPNENVTQVLETAFKFYVYNIIVLATKDNKTNIYSWSETKKCGRPHEVIQLDSCENRIFENRSILFYENSKNTWINCKLRVLPLFIPPYVYTTSTGQLDGLDVRSIEVIQKKMGFKIEYVKHQFRTWGLKNGNTYTNAFGTIFNDEADLLIGMWPFNFTQYWDFDPCFPLVYDVVTWIVPRAEQLPHWKKLANIYPLTVWIYCGILTVIFPTLWKFTDTFLSKIDIPQYQNWPLCFLNALAVFLSSGIPTPQPRTTTIRMMFITWVIFNLLWITMYQSKLVASLTKPQYNHQISTVEELINSDLLLGMNINLIDTFDDPNNKISTTIYRKVITCDVTPTCLNRTAFQRDLAIVKSNSIAKYLTMKYYTNPDGSSMIYLFKNTVVVMYTCMVFIKGHPMYDEYNQYVTWMSECGIIQFWLIDIRTKELRDNLRGKTVDESMALNLEQMKAAFVLLAIGLGCASIVFVYEFGCVKKKTQIVQNSPNPILKGNEMFLK